MAVFNSNVLAGASGQTSGAAAGYKIDRSLRFNSPDSAYLNRTPSSAGNRKTWTWSGWVKRSELTVNAFIFGAGSGIMVGGAHTAFMFTSGDNLQAYDYTGSGYAYNIVTTRLFRDPAAWYHIVLAIDTTQSTSTDRVKLYINGELQTALDTTTYPSQNYETYVNTSSIAHQIGHSNSDAFDGYLADVHFIDGQALAPTDFGEYDSNSVWQPKEFTETYTFPAIQTVVWSNNLTADGGGSLSGTTSNGFNGDEDDYVDSSDGATLDLTGHTFGTGSHYIRVKTGGATDVTVNGTSLTDPGGGGAKVWYGTITGELTTLSVEGGASIYFITVDGKYLIDQGLTLPSTNSFYLKFADNSSNAALGTDSSGVGTNLPGVDFDGSNDHVESADDADYSLGTNDFTMEAYIYPRDFDNYKAIMMKYTGTRSTSSWWWSLNSSGHILFYLYYGSSEMGIVTSGTGMTLNKWNHVACVRDGSTARVYINGVQVGTGNISTNSVNDSSTAVRIGEDSQGVYDFDGIISNVRLINGTCLYTNGTTFTVPATPLTNVTNTKLLCCQSSSSATAATVSPNTLTTSGDPFATSKQDTAWTVNNLTAAYNFGLTNAAQIVGTSKTFSFPITYTSTLTYEFFVRITTDGTYNYMAKMTGDQWNLGTSGSDLLFGNYNGGWTTFSSTGLNDSEWHFVRLTTTGSSTSLYVDGSLIATNSSGGSVSTGSEVTNEIRGTGTGAFEIAHLRITTGGTPPTTGVPDISTMNAAAGSGGTLAFYDALDDIASSGTKTSDGGNVTITMSAATVGVTDINADSLVDTPTNGNSSDDTGAGGEISGNYCVINPLGVSSNTPTISDGNLKMVHGASQATRHGTMGVTSGKWYFEVVFTAASPLDAMIGVANKDHENSLGVYNGGDENGWGYYYNGEIYNNGGQGTYGASYGVNDVIGVALDMDNGALYFSKNGTYQNSGDPTSGSSKTGAAFTNLVGIIFPCINGYGGTQVVNFGQRPFVTSAPSGYKCWNTANLPTPTIPDGSTAFDTVLYSGDGQTTQTIALPFAPGLLWQKKRSHVSAHYLLDAVRGFANDKALASHDTEAEGVNSAFFTFSQSGSNITVGDYGTNTGNEWNTSGRTHVIWTWDAGSSTASNTDGSITADVRANTSAGFSIVTYTGNATNGATVGHGLNAAPDLIIIKNRDDGGTNWNTYHSALGGTKALALDSTDALITNSLPFNNTNPTSSVFTIGGGGSYSRSNNQSGEDHVAYCFAPVEGYSAFGSYTGNGSNDGPFIYTGFRPKFILRKQTNSAQHWHIVDTERDPENVTDSWLFPNLNDQEGSGDSDRNTDILSNGFKIRSAYTYHNQSGSTYIYAAFAEHPFKTSRAR